MWKFSKYAFISFKKNWISALTIAILAILSTGIFSAVNSSSQAILNSQDQINLDAQLNDIFLIGNPNQNDLVYSSTGLENEGYVMPTNEEFLNPDGSIADAYLNNYFGVRERMNWTIDNTVSLFNYIFPNNKLFWGVRDSFTVFRLGEDSNRQTFTYILDSASTGFSNDNSLRSELLRRNDSEEQPIVSDFHSFENFAGRPLTAEESEQQNASPGTLNTSPINSTYDAISNKVLALDQEEVANNQFSAAQPIQNNHTYISREFARINNLKIGDIYNFGGPELVIAGFAELPDYAFPLIDITSPIPNPDSQTFVVVNSETYFDITSVAGGDGQLRFLNYTFKFDERGPPEIENFTFNPDTFDPQLAFPSSDNVVNFLSLFLWSRDPNTYPSGIQRNLDLVINAARESAGDEEINSFINGRLTNGLGFFTNSSTTTFPLVGAVWAVNDQRWLFNVRTYFVDLRIEANQLLNGLLLLVILLLSLLMMLIIIYQIITKRKKSLGILKANGYKNRELLLEPFFLLSIPIIVGSFIGYIIGFFVQGFINLRFQRFFSLPIPIFYFDVGTFLIVTLAIPAFLIIVCMIVSFLLIKPSALELSKNSGETGFSKTSVILGNNLSHWPFLLRFWINFILRSPFKITIMAVTGFVGGFIFLFSIVSIFLVSTFRSTTFGNIDYNFNYIFPNSTNVSINPDDFEDNNWYPSYGFYDTAVNQGTTTSHLENLLVYYNLTRGVAALAPTNIQTGLGQLASGINGITENSTNPFTTLSLGDITGSRESSFSFNSETSEGTLIADFDSTTTRNQGSFSVTAFSSDNPIPTADNMMNIKVDFLVKPDVDDTGRTIFDARKYEFEFSESIENPSLTGIQDDTNKNTYNLERIVFDSSFVENSINSFSKLIGMVTLSQFLSRNSTAPIQDGGQLQSTRYYIDQESLNTDPSQGGVNFFIGEGGNRRFNLDVWEPFIRNSINLGNVPEILETIGFGIDIQTIQDVFITLGGEIGTQLAGTGLNQQYRLNYGFLPYNSDTDYLYDSFQAGVDSDVEGNNPGLLRINGITAGAEDFFSLRSTSGENYFRTIPALSQTDNSNSIPVVDRFTTTNGSLGYRVPAVINQFAQISSGLKVNDIFTVPPTEFTSPLLADAAISYPGVFPDGFNRQTGNLYNEIEFYVAGIAEGNEANNAYVPQFFSGVYGGIPSNRVEERIYNAFYSKSETFDYPHTQFGITTNTSPNNLDTFGEDTEVLTPLTYDIASYGEGLTSVIELQAISTNIIVIFSLLIILFCFYTMSSLTIKENKELILMFKVLGYRNWRILLTFIGSFIPTVVFTTLLSVPFVFLITNFLSSFFIIQFNAPLPLPIFAWQVIVAVIAVILVLLFSFLFISWGLRRKKISTALKNMGE